jgi:NADH-quinone oxidoreductase subunit F
MREILDRICKGQGKAADLEELEDLAYALEEASLCALGKTAANPVVSTLRYFPEEYRAHIEDHRCPAGVCKDLTLMEIDQQACTSCAACVKACSIGSVIETPPKAEGEKPSYLIDSSTCTACGSCREVCRYEAVLAVKRTGIESAVSTPGATGTVSREGAS